MPRTARIVIPEYPYHVTQRGNYRQEIFQEDRDREKYLSWIEEYSRVKWGHISFIYPLFAMVYAKRLAGVKYLKKIGISRNSLNGDVTHFSFVLLIKWVTSPFSPSPFSPFLLYILYLRWFTQSVWRG